MQEDTLFCANHPNRETVLRCNRCEKPICTECAVLTPVGYRCKECVRGQQKVFETASWVDLLIAFIISGIVSSFFPFSKTETRPSIIDFFLVYHPRPA